MATKIYGASAKSIIVEGDVTHEFRVPPPLTSVLVMLSDGTAIEARRMQDEFNWWWELFVLNQGPLFDRHIEFDHDEFRPEYRSDVMKMKAGIKRVWVASAWEEKR